MKYFKKITTKISLSVLLLLSMVATARAVGTLEPQGEAGDDTHKSLKDVFNKLTLFTNNPTGVNPSPFVTPTIIEPTFPTLTEIFDLLLAEDDDLIPENLAQGVTIFGVEGTLTCPAGLRTEWSEQPTEDDGFGGLDATTASWSNANTYCQNLEEDGKTDWDLPTFPELINGYILGDFGFYNSFYEVYWSSNEAPAGSGGGGLMYYAMEASNGSLFQGEEDSLQNFRCIR